MADDEQFIPAQDIAPIVVPVYSYAVAELTEQETCPECNSQHSIAVLSVAVAIDERRDLCGLALALVEDKLESRVGIALEFRDGSPDVSAVVCVVDVRSRFILAPEPIARFAAPLQDIDADMLDAIGRASVIRFLAVEWPMALTIRVDDSWRAAFADGRQQIICRAEAQQLETHALCPTCLQPFVAGEGVVDPYSGAEYCVLSHAPERVQREYPGRY